MCACSGVSCPPSQCGQDVGLQTALLTVAADAGHGPKPSNARHRVWLRPSPSTEAPLLRPGTLEDGAENRAARLVQMGQARFAVILGDRPRRLSILSRPSRHSEP